MKQPVRPTARRETSAFVRRPEVCVILAAGASSRMGSPKALLALGGRTFLSRAVDAAAGRMTVVVVADAPTRAAADALARADSEIRVVVNDRPELGMTHSLALADRTIADRGVACAVLLVDTPFVDAALVGRICDARADADVAYPLRDGVPGHPVVFGPRPRAEIATLANGDTLRRLRDDPRWTRAVVTLHDDAPYTDVDTRAMFDDLERRGKGDIASRPRG